MNIQFEIKEGYTEAHYKGEDYELQLPITPDSINTLASGEAIEPELAREMQSLIDAAFPDRTTARLSYAAGEAVMSYKQDGKGFMHCKLKRGDIVLREGGASNYYNVEYYEPLSEDEQCELANA